VRGPVPPVVDLVALDEAAVRIRHAVGLEAGIVTIIAAATAVLALL
jgi:hypothetical protein